MSQLSVRWGRPISKRSVSRRSIGLLAVFGILSIALTNPGNARAQDQPAPRAAEEQIDWQQVGISVHDAVVLRPLGALSTLGGFVFFLAAAPFVAPSGRIATCWDIFVYGPYDDTFVRPLGE